MKSFKPSKFFLFGARSPRSSKKIAVEEEHFVASLDSELFKRHPAQRIKGRWRGRFNLAAWVRFPEGLSQDISLMLIYRDSERRKTCKVDACRANKQTLILLNSKIDLHVAGEIVEAALVLEGLNEHAVWILDEYRLEPTNSQIKIPAKQDGALNV